MFTGKKYLNITALRDINYLKYVRYNFKIQFSES